MEIKLKDGRLEKRWLFLVRSQMKVSSPLAAGVGGLPNAKGAFAATQAAWRFYNNERVEFSELVAPMRDYVRTEVSSMKSPFVLVAHDWCKLSFPGHKDRQDMTELSNSSDVGYESTTALAINSDNGAPLAPVEMHLKTANGMLSTRDSDVPVFRHLDQVLPTMQASLDWNLGKPIVHVIDREADSVGHYHGRAATLEVAEVEVVLHRPARKSFDKVRVDIPGVPVQMRLILTRVLDMDGNVLAEWYLLSNVPVGWGDAATHPRCLDGSGDRLAFARRYFRTGHGVQANPRQAERSPNKTFTSIHRTGPIGGPVFVVGNDVNIRKI